MTIQTVHAMPQENQALCTGPSSKKATPDMVATFTGALNAPAATSEVKTTEKTQEVKFQEIIKGLSTIQQNAKTQLNTLSTCIKPMLEGEAATRAFALSYMKQVYSEFESGVSANFKELKNKVKSTPDLNEKQKQTIYGQIDKMQTEIHNQLENLTK